MQRRFRVLELGIFLFTVLGLCKLGMAETIYVQAKSATLRSGTTSLSRVVASVPFGQELELIEKRDHWYKVQVQNGAVGWVYHTKVGTHKPSAGESRLASLGSDFRQTRSSSITGTAGVRGLDEFSSGYANRAGIAARHRTAVERMTNYRLSQREVEAFLKSGRLGEYAE
jgi:hypothetical protein